MARQPINNLVKNGDFESGSGSASASTSALQWVGSKANGWGAGCQSGVAGTVSFDTFSYSGGKSLKVAATSITGTLRGAFASMAHDSPSGAWTVTASRDTAIPVLPNTSYTLTLWVYLQSNTGSQQAFFSINTFSGDGATTTGAGSGTLTTAGAWTKFTVSFTTNSTAAFASIVLWARGVTGETPVAWFDDIRLDTTAGTTRQPATRSAASNRLTVRDSGTALRFDGSSYVTVTHKAILNPPAITLSAYIYLTGYDTADASGFITKIGGYIFRVDKASRKLQFICTSTVNSIQLIEAGRWYHVVGTNDGTTSKMYINGVLENTYASTLGTSSVTDLFIGHQDPSRAWVGTLDEARIWNRALSAQEAIDLSFYNVVPRNGLVGEWLFNEGSGTTAYDTSDFLNHGTITGATYTTDVALKPRQAA